jgi:DNA-binding MarR family transcriptional regulator
MAGPDASDRDLAALADAVIALAHQLERRGTSARPVAALTGSEIMVLREAQRRPGVTATRIAGATGTQRSYVSALSHSLEQRGLLERCDARDGGRGVGFRLTDRAEADFRLVQERWVERLRRAPAELLIAATGMGEALDRVAHHIAAGDAASED